MGAEIYSTIRPVQIQDPLEQYAKMMSVRGMLDQSDLHAMQRQQLQTQLNDEDTLRTAGMEAGGNMTKLRDLLYSRGAPTKAMAIEQQRLKAEQEAATLDKTKVETAAARVKQTKDIIASIGSDADMPFALEQIAKLHGPDVAAKMPFFQGPFSHDKQRQAVMSADKLVEQLTPKFEKVDDGGTIRMVDVNPLTNPSIRTMNYKKVMTPGEVASNKVALGNLAIKGAEATPGGVFSIPEIVRQASGGAGAPAGGAGASAGAAPAGGALNALPGASGPSNPIQAAMASGATGEELLKQLPKPVADQVKMMVEGRMAPPTSFAVSKPYWQGMLSLAAQYDPAFDETVWKTRNETRAAFAKGSQGQNLTAINTAIGHLDSFDKAAQALKNGDFPAFNKMWNAVVPQVGGTNTAANIRTFEQAKEAVANELMRVFRGVGASSSDTAKWAETLNASDSPEALRAAVKSAVDLLDSRIGALSEQYKRGMSTSNDVDVLGMVYPKAKATLERLRSIEAPGKQEARGAISGAPVATREEIDAELRRRGVIK